MATIKNILVPTDFSEEANNALEVAATIAQKTTAKITLLHVVDVPEVGGGNSPVTTMLGTATTQSKDPGLFKEYMTRLLQFTKNKLNDLIQLYPNVDIKEHVVFDSLQKHLAAFVVKNETDLIVIGSKGASGIDEVLVGSNAEKVIRLSRVPVLTVKSKIPNFQAMNIVFASNFKKISPKVVDWIQNAQASFGATIHFVKVITPNTFEATPDTQLLIRNFAEKHKFSNYTINVFNYYTEEEGIRAFGDSIQADLLTLTTHGRTGIAHLMLGSIAEEVANHSTIPVLTFNQYFS
jgi:nucleotide-binding universal stress UspA family protein